MRWSCLASALMAAFLATPAPAAEPSADAEFFEKKVRPLLLAQCTSCHGPEKQKGGLRLDTRSALLKGGDSGPAIVPNDAEKSPLVQVVRYDGDVKMPPKGKLSDDDIAVLSKWVKAGAAWPNDAAIAGGNAGANAKAFDLAARAKAHWSFQPITRPDVPKVAGAANPVDAFLLEKLKAAKLSFAPPADRRTLIRRLTFDLIGLPPTPEEIEAFEKDASPNAYELLVEKLLASPHYGERWARHWLDLVRYAETCGHEFDFEIPDAWRYRDYVIRAFNADVPYDQFLHEHLAGDLLPEPRRHPKERWNESLLATGFWFFHEAKHSPVDSRADYADRLDNQIDVFGKTVYGLTISCARCHDHKFDPISTKDYYALLGVLASSRYQRAFIDDPAPTLKILDELKTARAALAKELTETKPRPLAPGEAFGPNWREQWFATGLGLRAEASDPAAYPHTARESARLAAALRSRTFTIEKPLLAIRVAGQNARARVILNGLELVQSPIYGGLVQSINHGPELRWQIFDLRMWKGQTAHLELTDNGPGFFAITDMRFCNEKPAKEPVASVPAPPSPELPSNLAKNENAKTIAARIRELEARIPAPRLAPALMDGNGLNEHVFIRGSHKNLGDEVPRRNLEAFGPAPFASSGSGRLELARAVTGPTNTLVARVMVNRLWKHHFGEGLVRSPDDFGYQGQPPTHPELLDWLATEFVQRRERDSTTDSPHAWSVKHLHRLMVLSAAYRQSSRATSEMTARAATADPLNKLLHRQHVRRLEAEAIRDALLSVSGRLDRRMEGPGVLPYLSDHITGRGRPASGPLDGDGRRSIYLQVRRNFLNPMFVAFDYPTPFTTIGRRSVSNVPAQALSMLNNPFVHQQAERWAKNVLAEPNATTDERVRKMYRTAIGRAPTTAELRVAVSFLTEQATEYGKPDHPQAWADFAHVLLNTKEFILVE